MNTLLACVGYPGKVSRSERSGGVEDKSIDIVFTGFSKYQSESKLIAESLQEMGYRFDAASPLLLEVILEEADPYYNHKILHFVNLISSLVSLTTIPYHVRTEHTLTFRFRNKGIVSGELVLRTVFHQWRGVLLIPVTYFFWPSSEFGAYLQETVKTELSKK